jgi:mRNA interferase HigB
MRIIAKRTLRAFWETHPDARSGLEAWYRVARTAEWRHITEVRKDYPHADAVGVCTVFNVRGGNYRLIVKIDYEWQIIFVKHIIPHREYDQGGWKRDCQKPPAQPRPVRRAPG